MPLVYLETHSGIGSDETARWTACLSDAGLDVLPLSDSRAHGTRLLLCSVADDEASERIRRLSTHGRERVLAVITGQSIGPEDTWRLLGDGASDVIGATEPQPASAQLIQRQVSRWSQIEEILESGVVRESLVGQSIPWKRTLARAIEAALFSSSPVLITGETGTGKELVARLIHMYDRQGCANQRASEVKPIPDARKLVLLDCTTVVPALSGSEFFGHERGAFTGATYAREGAFALADGGGLFLDEVGELPRPLQAELLRVIQEGSYKRVGGNTWRKTNFRLICATHRDPSSHSDSAFRDDFLYRIAALRVHLPPLRERPDDILPLARHFLAEMAPHGDIPGFDDAVSDLLTRREYPGNVRDLRQLVIRIVAGHTGYGPITAGHIPVEERPAVALDWREPGFDAAISNAVARGAELREIVSAASDAAVSAALHAEGTLRGAARRLAVTRRAIQKRQRRLRLLG